MNILPFKSIIIGEKFPENKSLGKSFCSFTNRAIYEFYWKTRIILLKGSPDNFYQGNSSSKPSPSIYFGEEFSQGKYHRGKVCYSVEEYSPLDYTKVMCSYYTKAVYDTKRTAQNHPNHRSRILRQTCQRLKAFEKDFFAIKLSCKIF